MVLRILLWFYGDGIDVAMGPLWMDLCRGRIVRILCVPPSVGGVVGVSTTVGRVMWGCHGVAAWLTRANASVG